MPRNCIRLAVLCSQSVVDAKVDAGEHLRLSCTLAIECFCCGEVLKVLMVREDLHLVYCSFAVLSPIFECVDDCKEFLVVDFVIDLRGLEFPGMKGHQV